MLFRSHYSGARQSGELSEAEAEIYFDVMISIERPETSVIASTYACVLLDRCLASSDGALREEAAAAATDLRELLDADPGAGYRDIMRLMQKHPKLSAGNWYSRFSAQPAPAVQH